MVERTNLTRSHQVARSSASRASIRDFDDKHLMQEITKADVFHSETPSNFERFQMVGMTSVPMKQKEEDKKQSSQSGGSKSEEGGDWSHDQPQGESAEALMLYMNGHRSHPVALVDDRRVRPFNMKPGESAYYAASGTGQMLMHSDKGSFLVVVDNKGYDTGKEGGSGSQGSGSQGSGGQQEEKKERMVSLRHVTKEKQSREIKEGSEPEEHVHEGKPDQVDHEIRATAKKIEILDGESVIAVYTKEDKSWKFSNFKTLTFEPSEEFTMSTKKITLTASDEMKIKCDGKFNLDGHPLLVNGGGPTLDPFTVP